METVKKKYGLWTGIAMVVGIVIGSGVFLKAGPVLALSGGKLWVSLLAWLIGGIIMIASGFCFAIFSTKITKFNGVIDYVEMSTNKKVAYGLSWLMTSLYYPTIASIVSVFASAYFVDLIGCSEAIFGGPVGSIYQLLGSWQVYLIAFGFLTIFATLNYFAPKIAGKFQISATIIKLIPIFVIAIVGLFASLFIKDGGIVNAFTSVGQKLNPETMTYEALSVNFGDAVRTTAFAYEGWVCATMINAELKNSKKNLPRALVGGTIAIVVFYLIYYIGVSATIGNVDSLPGGANTVVIEQGPNAPLVIFNNIFGVVGEKIFTVFIIVSCLGTVNGVVLATVRGMATMAFRGQGIAPEKISRLSAKNNMPLLSCVMGYAYCVVLLGIWYLANNSISVFKYLANMDAIVCALIYGCFIVMFVYMMRNFKELSVFKRYIMPIVAIIGCSVFVLVGTGIFQMITGLISGASDPYASLKEFGVWLVLCAVVMVPSIFFYKKDAMSPLDFAESEEIEEQK